MKTPEDYIAAQPEARQEDLVKVRDVVLRALPDGYVEALNWGMISYEVPLEVSGKTYNGKPLMYVALGNQKRHMGLYLCGLNCVPGLAEDFRARFAASGRKLDMGVACVRFKTCDDLNLDAVADAIAAVPMADFIETARAAHRKK